MPEILSMPEHCFAAVWRASWQASILVGLILLVQWLFRQRLPARARYALWALVVARLLMPAAPPSSFSVFNLGAATSALLPLREPAASEFENASGAFAPSDGADSRVHTTTALESNTREQGTRQGQASVEDRRQSFWNGGWLKWLTIVWLTGVVFLLIRTLVAAIRLDRQIRRLPLVSDPAIQGLFETCRNQMEIRSPVQLLATTDQSGPAVAGCWRPGILMPREVLETFSAAELRYIFLHELAHVRQRDVAVNWLLTVLERVHWFNPLIWYGFHRARADRELACDALVLEKMESPQRFDYGRTAIRLLEVLCGWYSRPPAGAVGLFTDSVTLKRRIAMIADYHKTSRWQFALGLLVFLGLGSSGLTGAREIERPVLGRDRGPIDASRPLRSDQLKNDARIVADASSNPAGEGSVQDKKDDSDEALREFYRRYVLEDDEILKRVAPPFPEGRMIYYRTEHRSQAEAIPDGPDTMYFRWTDGKLQNWGMSFGSGRLSTTLRILAGVYPQQIEADKEFINRRIPGDFIVSPDASAERIVEAIEKVLRDELKWPVNVEFREVEREVYVARGDFEFKPLPGRPDAIQIYARELTDAGGGGSGDFEQFLDWVGMGIDRPVVSDLEQSPAGQWSWMYHVPAGPATAEQVQAAKDPQLVLPNLTKQTGLTFTNEKRKIRMLFVEKVE